MRIAGRLYRRSWPKEPRSITHSRPCCVAWLHGSVLLAWYLAPHSARSRANALSVSVSAACCARSSARCGAGAGLTAVGAAPVNAASPRDRRAAPERVLHGCRFHSVTVAMLRSAAMPAVRAQGSQCGVKRRPKTSAAAARTRFVVTRSEEHTSELQSQSNLVCRLLLEKKNKTEPGVYHRPSTP